VRDPRSLAGNALRPSGRAVALAVLALAALALLPRVARATGSASLTVEVYRDLGVPAPSPEPTLERVELVVDLTRSMLRRASDGRSLAELARGGSLALMDSLDDRTEIALTVLGHRAGERCTEAERILAPAPAAGRRPTADPFGELAPRSEASLAGAVDRVRRDLERQPSARTVRVVLVTDLEDATADPCGGDLCEAAGRLVAAGAWLEVAPAGTAEPPACLTTLLPSPARPAPASARGVDDAPTFSVAAGASADGIVAEGRAGAGAIEVPSGLLTLVVQLDPPEQIGPFRLDPGESARVSVLESVEGGVPTRTWRLERGDEAVGRAFPPPDQLPREP
jgi:hypothetical protein